MTASSTEEASPMEKLVYDVQREVDALVNFFRVSGHKLPTFDRDTPNTVLPENAPQRAHIARERIMEYASKLFQLASGPSEYLANLQVGVSRLLFKGRSAAKTNKRYPFVPLESSITYKELANASNTTESRLKSVIRMAMTSGLFLETHPEVVTHSAISAVLRTNTNFHDWATFMCDISSPTAAAMVAAHERWPQSSDKTHTAYNVAFDHDLPFFQHLKQLPERHKQFSGYMRSVTASQGTHLKHLINGYDWTSLGSANIVDVGGSTGHTALALAQAYPKLNFIVQDLLEVVTGGEDYVNSHDDGDLRGRIKFQPHSFFDVQPLTGADVYLLRMILHDWSFDDAVKILTNLVDAMHPKSRIIIMDTVLPAPGSIPTTQERLLRVRDMTMMQVFNSQERDMDAWNKIFSATSKRLKINGLYQPIGSVMSLLELDLL